MVAMTVWPTDASDGSVATEARWRKMARHWAPTGVAPGVGGELKPTLAFPNLTVADGAAWVDGHYAELLGSQVLAATANGIAVVRFDPAANMAELVWRDGVTTPAQSPTGVYEMLVAQVTGSVLVDRRAMAGGSTGVIGYAELAAPSMAYPVGGETLITNLACAVTLQPTRTYRFSTEMELTYHVAGDRTVIRIKDPSGEIARQDFTAANISSNYKMHTERIWRNPPGGVHNMGVTIQVISATSNVVDVNASPTFPAFLLVEDIT